MISLCIIQMLQITVNYAMATIILLDLPLTLLQVSEELHKFFFNHQQK